MPRINCCRHLVLIELLAAGFQLPACAQAPPTQPSAPASAPTAKSLVDLAEALLVDVFPREYERKKDWGRTKLVTRGIKFEHDGLRLDLDIRNVRQDAKGNLSFQRVAAAPVQGFANFLEWYKGIRLFSVRADCDATVRLTLDAEAAATETGDVGGDGERLTERLPNGSIL